MKLSLPNFSTARVLVIGDVMLDCYWYGDTKRISPEAPVPVVHIKKITEQPGGASNVALNTKSLGAETTLMGLVGTDKTAQILKNKLQQAEINCYLTEISELPTINKLRVIGQNQQLIRLDFEENFYHSAKEELLKNYEAKLATTDTVIISDYGKGIAACIPQLIHLAKKHKIPVIIDPKGKDFSLYNGALLLTPNANEFTTIVGAVEDEAELEQKAASLAKKHKLDAILVTRGAKGMSLIANKQEALHIPTEAREVYDVTGAGDTVIATIGAALAAGSDLKSAVKLANLAAGIVVGKLGAATVHIAELRRALKKQQESWLGILDEEQLLQEIADAKAHNETIVMTNGCFDILHAGHISYLEQAKALGTRLIVAVNDDASIKRLKGKERPINTLEQRMAVLAGLRAVDWVVAFSEDTPERIIKQVTPDILVKGGDWHIDNIVGGEHVRQHGGKVLSLPYVDNHSTSAIIKQIRGKK